MAPFPEAGDPSVACDLLLAEDDGGPLEEARALADRMVDRVTNRRLGERRPLPQPTVDALYGKLFRPDLAVLRLTLMRRGFDLLAAMGKGSALEISARDALAATSAMGLLTIPGLRVDSYLLGCRALERIWFEATARELAIQPISAMIYLFARLERGGAEGLTEADAHLLRSLRRYRRPFEVAPDEAEVLLFLVGFAAPPTARSLRRPAADVLSFKEA